MKKYILPLFFLLVLAKLSMAQSVTTTDRNWLSKAYQKLYANTTAFPDLGKWQELQRTESLEAIAKLPEEIKQEFVRRADEALSYNWPSLPASLYLDYKNTGTRVNYENLSNERRKKLSHLVMGELIQNNGKYIPQIVNGLWLVLEESTWVAPAHIVVQKEGADLPNIINPYIDLHASRTGVTLAVVHNLLATKLAKYSKVINSRIVYELNRRIFMPYIKDDHYFWMGTKGNSVNNWNAFNNTNCLEAALLMLKPGDTLNRFSAKLLASADRFINQYPADGGCDEGPGYWDMAGGKIIRLIALANQASGNNMAGLNDPLLHQMGSYTYKMQIADQYVVNFADASATYTQTPESVYAFGELFKDEELKSFAAYLFQLRNRQMPSDDLVQFVGMAKLYPILNTIKPKAPYPAVSLLPNLQVFTARANKGSTTGLFFAAKGGHNAESHNHNDIGNFIVYADGKPLLIDAGVGTYTSKTFSNKRYELWNVQSQWHNCPSINGVQQQDGRNFAAKNFNYVQKAGTEQLSLDIAAAYPASAAVKEWKRIFTFNPKKNTVLISENYNLSAFKAPSILSFLTSSAIRQGNGVLSFGDTGYKLRYNPNDFEVKIETKPTDDVKFKTVWGEQLYRIQLISKNTKLSGQYNIEISKNNRTN